MVVFETDGADDLIWTTIRLECLDDWFLFNLVEVLMKEI